MTIDDPGPVAGEDPLSGRVRVLTAEVKLLRKDVGGLREQLATTRSRVWWVALVAVIALALAGSVAVTALRGESTIERLDGLCPVMALAVGSYDPSTRDPGPKRDTYVANNQVMRKAYVDSGCADVSPLVPPRNTP